MSGYILSVPAQEDVAVILDYYFEEAGHRVARKMTAEFVGVLRRSWEQKLTAYTGMASWRLNLGRAAMDLPAFSCAVRRS
jgi:plasmid stabilization system protein ParE